MHALCFHGIEDIRYSQIPDPALLEPTDAIVEVKLASICGSDLHVYHGRELGQDPGTVMGHELAGVIVEVGKEVRSFHAGQRVLSPFTTSCGKCFYCLTGLTCRCEKGNLFGWVNHEQGLQGAQAGYVRVPMADSTLVPLSNDLNYEKGLLLGDIFSTGYYCAENAAIDPAGVYVVIGCGPVGLMTILSAKSMGAAHLFAIDQVPSRLQKAVDFGAIAIDPGKENSKEIIFQHSNGRGADGVMEVVGSSLAMRLAIDLVRPGGIISSVGVHTATQFPFSPIEAYDKNLTFTIGRCPAKYYAERLIKDELIQQLPVEDIITHRFPLSEGKHAYEVFDKKLDNCIKALLVP
ncbi:MAG TPA: alcohol dehydrogenase family protein [Chitinophagaceae bacterium]|nr:alcohol dehydrogenase family protein [Chitinophagaceae bacterium]